MRAVQFPSQNNHINRSCNDYKKHKKVVIFYWTPLNNLSARLVGIARELRNCSISWGTNYKLIELDNESDGDAIQSALAEWTGQRTVPNVFISAKQIGGCDAVTASHNGGKLVPLLTEAGALASAS